MSTGPSVCLSVSLPLSLWRMNWAFWQHTHTHTHIHTHTHTHMHACMCVGCIYIYLYIYRLPVQLAIFTCLDAAWHIPACCLMGLSLSLSLSLTHTHTHTHSISFPRASARSLWSSSSSARPERHYKSGVGCSEYSALAIIPASCVSSVPLPHFKHPLSLARALSLSLARSLSDMHYSLSICDNITPLSPLPSLPPPPPV